MKKPLKVLFTFDDGIARIMHREIPNVYIDIDWLALKGYGDPKILVTSSVLENYLLKMAAGILKYAIEQRKLPTLPIAGGGMETPVRREGDSGSIQPYRAEDSL